MKFDAKKQSIHDPRRFKTLLGVGPMSKLCVDATIELANALRIPILMIASRRQIECAELGGGYVNSWTTEEFARYVRSKDDGDFIVLARDHGGPWQGTGEADLGYDIAFKRACISYRADIDAGFDVLHLDPSVKPRTIGEIKTDIKKLVAFCDARDRTGNLRYEVGTEETNGNISDVRSFGEFVRDCREISERIHFVVGQTGTLVKEDRNIGTFDRERAKALSTICAVNGFLLKEHNLDYVPDSVLELHAACGIHSANVAPEFGLIETKAFIRETALLGLEHMAATFLEISHASKKWEKWMVSERSDYDKGIIAGHYVLSHPTIRGFYDDLNAKVPFDQIVKADIKQAICRYLRFFGWLGEIENHVGTGRSGSLLSAN